MNFMEEYEAELLAEAKKQIAAEDAAWKALTEEQRQEIIRQRDVKLSAMAQAAEDEDESEDGDDEE